MATTYEAFMVGRAIKEECVEYVASKRFLGGDGKPIPWKLQTITSGKNSELRKASMKPQPIPGKKNRFEMGIDVYLYVSKLIVACTVFPDLNDKELQDSYGVMGAEELLDAMLLPGEKDALGAKVQEINGYDAEADEQVEEAKN